MRIAELEKKYKQYGLDKRTIDYYSSTGIIPFEKEEGSNYRSYGDKAEAVIKKIIILRDVGFSAKRIKKALDNPSYFTTAMWNEHISCLREKLAAINKHYDEMIKYAENMRDAASIPLNLADEIEDPKTLSAMASMFARIFKYVLDPDKLTELSENLDEDISDFVNCCVVFIKSIDKKIERKLSPCSPEVQQSVARFLQRLKGFYGIIVYLVFQFTRDASSSILDPKDEDVEDYQVFMRILEICVNWLRDAKTIENALDFDRFADAYSDKILEIDQEAEDSTFDYMTDIIKEICNLPQQITPEKLDKLQNEYVKSIESFAVAQEASSEELNEAKSYVNYVFKAIRGFIY